MLLVELHPYEYLYYNPPVGGVQGASGRYATDYWVNIMPEAVQDLQSYIAKVDRAGPTGAIRSERVASAPRSKTKRVLGSNGSGTGSKSSLHCPTHMNCDRALDGKVIATISRLGVPIGVVKNRRAIMQHDVARKN